MSTNETYDPALHITAGELRAIGVPIPARIPDCGWIARAAMHVASDATVTSNGRLNVNMQVTFSAPFRWINIQVTIPKEPTP